MNGLRCASCGKWAPLLGSRVRVVCNMRSKVCGRCAALIDKPKLAALFKPKGATK